MRDKKDNATLDLPGFGSAAPMEPEPKLSAPPRKRRPAMKQEQMELLEPTDTSGLPIWQNDPNLDLTGLPIWRRD
ncbi:hypothetical protein ACHMW6_22145 [Pseudoduganella sp. UC29_106]|uniref:hypothetical protein n=1 Tax=Pseudoduganella sp. UC29_106 TaxID=3374553 RepID=UPI003758162E